ncbi:nucleoside deaminase [Sphingobacterium bambusae]|uniref:Nucleoside deaminase n=1 Tax=Sphingobacterium bambusae TaxID=662858 RepID=A0ABW6BB61_9SPHI|nr:nucleoside deaminase [Sphingobacterium bambusae]WPL49117.1 nucleoside deaminase [Sphingobacterium bambusae]
MEASNHQEFMRKAIALSKQNLTTLQGGPFGCVIVKDGKILSAAANSVTADCDPTAHAEVNAIRQAAKELGKPDLSGCILYSSAEPCPMCLSAIYWANIAKVYYGNSAEDVQWAGFGDQFLADELQKPPRQRRIQLERICASEAIKVFELWRGASGKTAENLKDGSL